MEQPRVNLKAVVTALKTIFDDFNQLWIKAEQDMLSVSIKKRIVELNHGIGQVVMAEEAAQKEALEEAARMVTRDALKSQMEELPERQLSLVGSLNGESSSC